MEALFKIADKTTQTFTFDIDSIKSFSTLAGDKNPLHHDDELAKKSRFGGIIASGTQSSALMMGAVSTFFSERGLALGLEFNFKFLKAIPANETVTIKWEVTGVNYKEKLKGFLIELEGVMRNEKGVVFLSARSTCLSVPFDVL